MAASLRTTISRSKLLFTRYLSPSSGMQWSTNRSTYIRNKLIQCKQMPKYQQLQVRQCSGTGTPYDEIFRVKDEQQMSDPELAKGIAYMESEEYIERYGSRPFFAGYRRNHKGRVAPKKTRKVCVRGSGENTRISGNPCPICRDQNLVIHYKNAALLEQLMCPHSGEIYSDSRTGICQKQYKKLVKTIAESKGHGLLPFAVPFVRYNYDDYYTNKTLGLS